MDKLIITSCESNPRLTAREIADAARGARDAGAAIVHVHKPFTSKKELGSPMPVAAWMEVRKLIEQESDIIFQHGMGGRPYEFYEHRVPPEEHAQPSDLKAESPEMISSHLAALDHDFGPGRPNTYVMPMREEMAKWVQLLRESNIKPEFEAWHIGAYWNLRWLIDGKLVDPPYFLTLFFGGNNGVWSPPNIEELHHRVKYIPQPSLWEVSVMCGVKGTKGSATTQEQLAIFAQAIAMGGHIRVGKEDNANLWDGVPAKSNTELVERVLRIARDLGREVATPDEARQIIGLPPKHMRRR